MVKPLSLLLLLLLLIGCAQGQAADRVTELPTIAGDAERGAELFRQPVIGDPPAPGCVNCHGLDDSVRLVGPSIPAFASSDAEYLFTSIVDPNAYYAEGVRRGGMIDYYAQTLTEPEIADLIAYLSAQ